MMVFEITKEKKERKEGRKERGKGEMTLDKKLNDSLIDSFEHLKILFERKKKKINIINIARRSKHRILFIIIIFNYY